MTLWYKYTLTDRQTNGEATARVVVPPDSPWFDGHFPEEPVLPGVAQLAMVHDLICRMHRQSSPVLRLNRVRFKQMIRPDQELTLTVEACDKAGDHRFRISDSNGLICSGMMVLAKKTRERTTL